jgi:hypothetical protein
MITLRVDPKAVLPGPIMNNHHASKTIWILTFIVAVVPVGAGGVGSEDVRIRIARLNRTRSYPGSPIVGGRASLKHAMEMKRRCLVAQVVVDSNRDRIAYIAFNRGNTRPLLAWPCW